MTACVVIDRYVVWDRAKSTLRPVQDAFPLDLGLGRRFPPIAPSPASLKEASVILPQCPDKLIAAVQAAVEGEEVIDGIFALAFVLGEVISSVKDEDARRSVAKACIRLIDRATADE